MDVLLRNLLLELRTPLRPDAVCKLPLCTTIQQVAHILPSENIHLSDPDYRGFYRVYCRDNCVMEYHKTCWVSFKENFKKACMLTKLPTERDFFGKECFTPDCGGRIFKIEVHDQDGSCSCFGDKTLEEERDKKKEAKLKRDADHKSKLKITDLKKFKKNKFGAKSSPPEDGPSGEITTEDNAINPGGDDDVPKPEEPVDYSAVDLSNARVIKKNRHPDDEDEEENKPKKKGKNKKAYTSLGEFIGNTNSIDVRDCPFIQCCGVGAALF